ncbi:DUF6069 family protein [Ornithinimicrobium cavernae]|uniref:DUF6069 family protein n=1 Tax=Ornithinimicrobium cavernae TaxID=2666047 RepID=UPI000D68AAE5|nr:DUF6069 family protein [Ornithinimicrobium cavernae]
MSRTIQGTRGRDRTTQEGAVPWSSDLVAVGAAMICALVMWLCVALWGGVELDVVTGGDVRRVGGVTVVTTAALAGLAGVGLLRTLERLTPRALRIWTVIAVAVALVSALGPLSARTPAATGTLLGLHAVVAVVLIVAVHRTRRWVG